MKELVKFISEQLETETIPDKLSYWFMGHPEQLLLWQKICDEFDRTHKYDDKYIEKFLKDKDIKAFIKFMQDDINADIDGVNPADTIKQIISNRK